MASVILRMRGNSLNLHQERFSVDIRKNFISDIMVMHCNRMPREVVESSSLEVFKNLMDMALRDMASGHSVDGSVAGLDDLSDLLQPQ